MSQPASIHHWAVIHQAKTLFESTELTEALTWRRVENKGVGIIRRIDTEWSA